MIAVLLFGIAFGIGQAFKDFSRLDEIIHGWPFWTRRALWFTVPALLILYALYDAKPLIEQTGIEMMALPFAASAIIATSTHRYALNRLRKRDGRYISTSNGYDRFWLDHFGAAGGSVAFFTELTALMAVVITHYV